VRPDLGGRYVPPAGPAQELVAQIWARVLGVDRVGAADNFFELGGHSLLATQVISRVRVAFDTDIPLAALFDHPTVDGLAGVIEVRLWEEIERMAEDEVIQVLDAHPRGTGLDEDGVSR